MIVENLTANYLYFGSYSVAPNGGTVTVPDAEYNSDNLLADRINSMYAGGSIDVASPPSGFPRDIDLSGSSGGGGGGTPGGSDGQVQYNDGGAFGGAAGFTFDDATGAVAVSATDDGATALLIKGGGDAAFGGEVADFQNTDDESVLSLGSDGSAFFDLLASGANWRVLDINSQEALGISDDGSVRVASAAGELGFFAATPVAQQAEPTTVQDIADALAAYGLLEDAGTIEVGGGPATRRVSIFHHGTRSDDTGEASFEPADINFGSNDLMRQMVLGLGSNVAGQPSVKHGAYGSFDIPTDYGGGAAKIIVVWSATLTSGDVVFDFDYRAVGGNDAEGLDDSSWQESVTVTDTAPGTARRRLTAEMTLTPGNFAVGDTVLFFLGRDGAAGGDTMAGRAYLFDAIFEYDT
jgi:hypothetical protein